MRKPAIELLTVRETAELLRVSPITVRRHIAAGHIKAVRIGRAVRVPRTSLRGLIKPVRPAAQRPGETPVQKGKPFTFDDPLWQIVGMFESDGPTDVAENKHKYLAEAYADLHMKGIPEA